MELNEAQAKSFERSKQILTEKGKIELANQIVEDIVKGRTVNAFYIKGIKFYGDVFFTNISERVNSKLPEAKTFGQKQLNAAMTDYVSSKLIEKNFWVHN